MLRAILRCPVYAVAAVADPPMRAQAAMRDIVPGIGCFKTPKSCSPRKTSRRPYHHPAGDPCPDFARYGTQGRMPHLRGETVYRVRRGRPADSDEASAKGLRVCARTTSFSMNRHPVLTQYLRFDRRGGSCRNLSFRTVRHAPGTRKVLRADHQLLDILPYPVYLLLQVLEQAGEGA